MAEIKMILKKEEVKEMDEVIKFIDTLDKTQQAKLQGFLEGVKMMSKKN